MSNAPLLDLLSVPTISPLSELLARNSACARLANLLLSRRGSWVDGRELSKIGGYAAYRTRLSELRFAPWHLSVINRYRHVTQDGRKFIVSEYGIGVTHGE